MSEKRKPSHKIVAQKDGKRTWVELFPVSLWPGKFNCVQKDMGKRYRVRINGRWRHGDSTFTITEVMRQLRSWLT